MVQKEYHGIESLSKILKELNEDLFLLVCDNSYSNLCIYEFIESMDFAHITFNNFSSNPLHEDAKKGLAILLENGIKTIVVVGGGSSMDIAKCIKHDSHKLDIKIIVIPTTAGTGAESTKHIVVYSNGNKESISDENVIPDYIIFEPNLLKTLPPYQKYSTFMDAFCQSVESYWSLNSTEESRKYSSIAMKILYDNYEEYLSGNYNEKNAENVMYAANLAGKAINISETTAAHAMSYKLTSKYNVPHGHAVAMCLWVVWMLSMNKEKDNCKLKKTMMEIVTILGLRDELDISNLLHSMLNYFEARCPVSFAYDFEIEELANSVNPTRMKNNPIQFSIEELKNMYRTILKDGGKGKYEDRSFH